MNIIFNGQLETLPNDYMTLTDLLKWKKIKSEGTAVVVNDKLILKNNRDVFRLNQNDRVNVISAAWGG